MKKDIVIPKSTNVGLAIIKNNEEYYEAFLVNNNQDALSEVLINISASKEDKITSNMRRRVPLLQGNSAEKLENILTEVLAFKSTYFITYFLGDKMFEKKITVENPDINKTEQIDALGKEGIMLW